MGRISIGVWIFLSILLVVVAGVGVTIYINQQENLRQQQAVDRDKKQEQTKKAQEDAIKFDRDMCIAAAEKPYWDYIKLNATSSYKDTSGNLVYKAPQAIWDKADSARSEAKDDCYRKYQVD